jgi:hypothetical protein
VPFAVFELATSRPIVSTTWKGGSMHFTGDSSRLLVAEWPGRVRWFKIPSGEQDGGWDFAAPPEGKRHRVFGISRDGSIVAYKGPAGLKDESRPGIVNGRTGEVIRSFTRHFFASDVSLSADGRRAALLKEVAADACTLEIVDADNGNPVAEFRVSARVVPVFTLSADGESLFVHDSQSNKLQRLDVAGAKKQ